MSILLNLAMFPTDKGTSVSQYVSRVIKMIDESGASYQLNSMGTTIETATMPEALQIVQKAYDLLSPDSKRIYCTITMDIKEGTMGRMTQKIDSIERHIGSVQK